MNEPVNAPRSQPVDESPDERDAAPRPPQRLRSLVSWQAGKVSTIGARATARHMPLTARADFAVLAALEEFGALSQAELGRRLGLDRNDISGTVTRLDATGSVDRRADPGDRRRNLVTLTDAGAARLQEIQHAADQAQAELLTGLDQAERRALQALLAKLLDAHRPEPA
ncbi:MarR family transcriptional regulator [Cellulomonas sp. 73-145]|uniref:MarR family winged helix-turn-helix transcriptional regulator n=1 Tax=Cellulomonas sp. 73-145 TaxID=1895739 RepID=UPI0025BDF9E2|nr:MarR family transcriptional regulator [Cellulomonas sp. 73-145]